MAYELWIIGSGIVFGLIGFVIGILLVRRAYKQSPSINHYQKIIDILTLRKLRNKYDGLENSKSLKTAKDHIEHYEGMRDKLTIRKKKEIEVTNEGGGGLGIISNLIGGFVVILIGVSLIPVIMQSVNQAQKNIDNNPMNVTSPTLDFTTNALKFIPIFFGIAIVGIAIAVVFSALRGLSSSGVV